MGIKDAIRSDFKNSQDKKRNFSRIRLLFDLSEKNEYTIDDQTWEDINMDDIFTEVDRTYSTAGEEALYMMLRTPLMDEDKLNQRSRLIDSFIKNQDLSTELRHILFKLGRDKKNRLLEMIVEKLPVNKFKYIIYSILGKVIPFMLILLAILLQEPRFILALLVSVSINTGINAKERDIIKANGLEYLRALIKAGEKVSKIKNKEISYYSSRIEEILDDIKILKNGTRIIGFINALGGVMEFVSVPFLLEEATFYKISDQLETKSNKIFELFFLVGELDALIGVASFKACNSEKCTYPQFIEENKLRIVDGIHLVLKEAVPNTINIDGKGIVLTGTNMSGKSTFLRMIGSNILLAQTMNFVMAKEYEGCFMNLVSSIAPKDDINNGKSYYLAEAESILRIINALEKEVTVFCPIDEIFRGTNPVERISASSEILKYINSKNAICIVATHDRELTDMLKEEYEFYYFSENVDEKNGLSFDYKLKQGVSKTRNAIKLLSYIGYPKVITKKALEMSEQLEKYI